MEAVRVVCVTLWVSYSGCYSAYEEPDGGPIPGGRWRSYSAGSPQSHTGNPQPPQEEDECTGCYWKKMSVLQAMGALFIFIISYYNNTSYAKLS